MKTRQPFITPLSLGLTVILLLGLSFNFWLKGNSLFSPGGLSSQGRSGLTIQGYSSHAAFQTECRFCHQPLSSIQANQCTNCHTNVEQEIQTQTGPHGQIQQVQQCSTCHPDHRGANFDMLEPALARFDHSKARFSLNHHLENYNAIPMACSACHDMQQDRMPFQADSCSSCHSKHDAGFMEQHIQDYGKGCLSCHDGVDRMANFDHQATGFPLEGKHAQAQCSQCHPIASTPNTVSTDPVSLFKNASPDCAGCHAEPDVHKGQLGLQCQGCHTVESWSPAIVDGKPFAHESQTNFSLVLHKKDYASLVLTCQACHPTGISRIDLNTCTRCHSQKEAAFMQTHTDQYGSNCLQCHDGKDRMHGFDHNTFFVLDGKHAQIDCASCHANQTFASTPSACVKCHAEPDIHKGSFGLECQICHTSTAWQPAYLKTHIFPLDHGNQGVVACQVCHPQVYPDYTCYGCHEHQQDEITRKHTREKIALTDLPNCIKCHPTGGKDEQHP